MTPNYDDRTRRFDGPGGDDLGRDPAYGRESAYPAGADYGRDAEYGREPAYGREEYPRDPDVAPRREPKIDLARLAGSVAATMLVAALAGWLVATIVTAIFDRFGQPWSNGGNTPIMYAVYGAVAALLAGVLWYLLAVGTPDPSGFFGWVIALCIVAAIALPLLVSANILDGLAAAIVHICIGLPIYALTGTFVRTRNA